MISVYTQGLQNTFRESMYVHIHMGSFDHGILFPVFSLFVFLFFSLIEFL